MALAANLEDIRRTVALFLEPGGVIELRIPKAGRERVVAGYFDNAELAARAAFQLSGKYPGIYFTLNPVKRDLLSRAANRAKPHAENLTVDSDITRRRCLLLDFDPVRPTGISSTAGEHDLALAAAREAALYLAETGWPSPIWADSGNGGHLIYRVDLPNNGEATELVKRVLEVAAQRWTTPAIDVDVKVFNAARISKAYGTVAQKGDSTPDRPHRLSRILDFPEQLQVVPLEALQQFAAEFRADEPKQAPRSAHAARKPEQRAAFELEQWLRDKGVPIHRGPDIHEGSERWVLGACPFNPDHRAPDAAIFRNLASGRLGFVCLHNSCAGKGWKEFRDFYEPQRAQVQRSFAPFAPIPGESDTRDEIPLSPADIEAAVDAAILANDLPGALRLIPDIAIAPHYTQALIVAKLRVKFRRDFSARDFSRAIRAVEEERARKNAPAILDDDLPPDDAPDLIGEIPLTDSGNGERVLKLHGTDIRFCPEFKKWLLWDGRRWKVDTDAATVTQKVKGMARLLYRQAALIADKEWRYAVQKHARDAESQGAITAALLRCKSEAGMSISAADLDKHRYLLNCMNGVVDVRTGDLLPFDRGYYITKLCHVNYKAESNSEKDCPRFMKLLYWAMGETPDQGELPERVTRMVDFLQRSFGYSLTGDVSEKAAFICYGAKGNNGKTTLLTIFKTILAEYATQLDINTLMTSKFTDNNVRADLARLHGARFVMTSEVDDGQRLSERLMKYLTAGMGEITACRKFENPFEFIATHKIWMDCNYRPEIKGADEAIWTRLKCVPFLRRIDKNDPAIDKQLVDKILAESEGVLAWAIRGAMRWAKDGNLGDPPEVAAAGAEWREADDPLAPFLEECCEVDVADPFCYCRCTDFTKAYQAWCKDNNEPQLKSSRLIQRLMLKGIKLNRSRRISDAGKQARCWDGVRLVTQFSGPPVSGSGGDFDS
ncbi:MAG TPA: phage/plasmid primase, P4 family [Bryobacteraceae bacterium]|nr:phage/plasmid primase, P4 family [Bryobacteraceae bacterium]